MLANMIEKLTHFINFMVPPSCDFGVLVFPITKNPKTKKAPLKGLGLKVWRV